MGGHGAAPWCVLTARLRGQLKAGVESEPGAEGVVCGGRTRPPALLNWAGRIRRQGWRRWRKGGRPRACVGYAGRRGG